MNRTRFGAVRLPLLGSAVLASFAVSLSAQVVEKGRTYADLVATHPCNSGNSGRLARVTDAQSSSSIGGGGGSTQVWAVCNGVDTWTLTAIGGSGGGVSGLTTADGGTALADNAIVRGDGTTGIQGSTVTVADSTGNLQWEGTTADGFEGNFTFADPTADWTWAWGADGALTGATQFNLENLRLDGNTLSSTDTNGNINLTPNGTGKVVFPIGNGSTIPGLAFAGDETTGLTQWGDGNIAFTSNGTRVGYFSGTSNFAWGVAVDGGFHRQSGFIAYVEPNTAGSGSPNIIVETESQKVITNEGSTAEQYNTLPTASAGLIFEGCVQDSDGLRFTASAGDTIRSVASVTTSGGYITSTTIGSCVSLKAINSTEWMALSITGTWAFN